MISTKRSFEEYTANELTALIQELIDGSGSSAYQDRLLENFIKVTEHPEGSDLIYQGESAEGCQARQILAHVVDWRASKSLPGLKQS